jgi:hypothetical protein
MTDLYTISMYVTWSIPFLWMKSNISSVADMNNKLKTHQLDIDTKFQHLAYPEAVSSYITSISSYTNCDRDDVDIQMVLSDAMLFLRMLFHSQL